MLYGLVLVLGILVGVVNALTVHAQSSTVVDAPDTFGWFGRFACRCTVAIWVVDFLVAITRFYLLACCCHIGGVKRKIEVVASD